MFERLVGERHARISNKTQCGSLGELATRNVEVAVICLDVPNRSRPLCTARLANECELTLKVPRAIARSVLYQLLCIALCNMQSSWGGEAPARKTSQLMCELDVDSHATRRDAGELSSFVRYESKFETLD